MVVNGRVLSISFLNKTDNGTYRCEAKNPIGRNSTEYVLIVHGECILLSFFGACYAYLAFQENIVVYDHY